MYSTVICGCDAAGTDPSSTSTPATTAVRIPSLPAPFAVPIGPRRHQTCRETSHDSCGSTPRLLAGAETFGDARERAAHQGALRTRRIATRRCGRDGDRESALPAMTADHPSGRVLDEREARDLRVVRAP